jgi:hypothetical protein
MGIQYMPAKLDRLGLALWVHMIGKELVDQI